MTDLTYVQMFSVYDSNSGYHNIPFFAGSALEAKHRVRQMLLEQNLSSDKLSGMTLERVGTFDYSTGFVCPTDSTELVAILSDLVDKEGE